MMGVAEDLGLSCDKKNRAALRLAALLPKNVKDYYLK